MNGQMVFKHAITRFTEVINEGLQYNKWKSADNVFNTSPGKSQNLPIRSKEIRFKTIRFLIIL